MARPQRSRRVCKEPLHGVFAPEGGCPEEVLRLSVDEFEAIRLIDCEGKTHEQCAAQMDISRTTVTEIYERARKILAEAIVFGKGLEISGGRYRICGGSAQEACGKPCQNAERYRREHVLQEERLRKGENGMRIAATYENGEIFQHFGHTEQFKLYDVENGAVVKELVVSSAGSGHGALAGFLKNLAVDALICGGIGGGAQQALAAAGIRLYGGVRGNADAAVQALLADSLAYDSNVHCDHHGHHHAHGHDCGSHAHSCGEHRCHD